jgi:hypothetical protein
LLVEPLPQHLQPVIEAARTIASAAIHRRFIMFYLLKWPPKRDRRWRSTYTVGERLPRSNHLLLRILIKVPTSGHL